MNKFWFTALFLLVSNLILSSLNMVIFLNFKTNSNSQTVVLFIENFESYENIENVGGWLISGDVGYSRRLATELGQDVLSGTKSLQITTPKVSGKRVYCQTILPIAPLGIYELSFLFKINNVETVDYLILGFSRYDKGNNTFQGVGIKIDVANGKIFSKQGSNKFTEISNLTLDTYVVYFKVTADLTKNTYKQLIINDLSWNIASHTLYLTESTEWALTPCFYVYSKTDNWARLCLDEIMLTRC